jgi:hypothetical protein
MDKQSFGLHWVFFSNTWSCEVSTTQRLQVTIHTARTHASNWLHLSLGVTRLVRPTTSGYLLTGHCSKNQTKNIGYTDPLALRTFRSFVLAHCEVFLYIQGRQRNTELSQQHASRKGVIESMSLIQYIEYFRTEVSNSEFRLVFRRIRPSP